MQIQPSQVLAAAQRGLALRKYLSIAVESTLVSLVSAALYLLTCLLQGIVCNVSMILLPGLVPGFVFLLVRLRRGRTSPIQAGLYLDHHFGLQERMCSLAAVKQDDLFAEALNEEIRQSVAEEKQLFHKTFPDHTCYLALPIAAIAALFLLAQPGIDDPGNFNSGSLLTDNSTDRAAKLDAELRKALERYRQTRSKSDLAVVHALQKQLRKALSENSRTARSGLQAGNKGGERRKASAADGIEAGAQADIVDVAVSVAAAPEIGGNRVAAVSILTETPDWDRFVGVESPVPLTWRKGIQHYIAAVAAEE